MHHLLLGDEHDDAPFRQLGVAIQRLGGTIKDQAWVLGGSQEFTTYEIELPDGRLKAIAETYIGLSLNGPEELVIKVAKEIRK